MNKIIALVLVGATLGLGSIAAPAFAVDTKISKLCGPDGPAAYKRPGGYCEQIGSNGTSNDGGTGQHVEAPAEDPEGHH